MSQSGIERTNKALKSQNAGTENFELGRLGDFTHYENTLFHWLLDGGRFVEQAQAAGSRYRHQEMTTLPDKVVAANGGIAPSPSFFR